MKGRQVPVQVFVADEQSDQPVDPARIGALAERVLADRGIRGEAELTVLFVDEEAIASLNERFLGREGPTDVLAFPIEDGTDLTGPVAPPAAAPPTGSGPGRGPAGLDEVADRLPGGPGSVPLLLGDVVACPAVAHRNARRHEVSYDDELALLVVHGILHLLGSDHELEEEAEEMEAIERDLLAKYHRSGASDGSDGPARSAGSAGEPSSTGGKAS